MLKVLESKSERIDLELKSDPNRSDREIGRICGVDGKTVRAHRAKIPQLALEDSAPLQNSADDGENSAPDSAVESLEAENSPKRHEASQVTTPPTDSPDETVLLPAQGEITIGWNKDGGMILRQSDWPNEDAVIVIARDYLWTFIDRLTDAMGVPSTKGLTR
jgi:hypothetical protein